MLASLLPGIRDLRVPLSAGFIWIAAAWTSLGWLLPDEKTAPEFLKSFYVLNTALGATVMLAVVGFVAYVLGIVLAPINVRSILQKINGAPVSAASNATFQSHLSRKLLDAKRQKLSVGEVLARFPDLREVEFARASPSEREEMALEQAAEDQPKPSSLDYYVSEDEWEWLLGEGAEKIGEQAVSELHQAEISLQSANTAVFDRYDRIRAEAEFRSAIAVPLAVLSIALMFRTGIEFLYLHALFFELGVVASFYLAQSAASKEELANDVLIQAISAGVSISPTLELLNVRQDTVVPAPVTNIRVNS